MTAWQNMSDGP